MKGAAVRNRLKRQLRALIYTTRAVPLKSGLDLVVVIHPKTLPIQTASLQEELRRLCKQLGALA
jgi:ribonuclease P protein component